MAELPNNYSCDGQMSLEDYITSISTPKRRKATSRANNEVRQYDIVYYVEDKCFYECEVKEIPSDGYYIYNPALGYKTVSKVWQDKEKAIDQLRKNFERK